MDARPVHRRACDRALTSADNGRVVATRAERHAWCGQPAPPLRRQKGPRCVLLLFSDAPASFRTQSSSGCHPRGCYRPHASSSSGPRASPPSAHPPVPRRIHTHEPDSDDESAYASRSSRAPLADSPTSKARVVRTSESQNDQEFKQSAVALARASGKISPWVLHPNTPFRGTWDALQICILGYVAFAVPYRMGFDADAYGGWYVLEFLVDLYFWIDVGFGFCTAYWEHGEVDDEVRYVTDLTKIKNKYLRTWFLVDLLACLPVEYVSRALKGLLGKPRDSPRAPPGL